MIQKHTVVRDKKGAFIGVKSHSDAFLFGWIEIDGKRAKIKCYTDDGEGRSWALADEVMSERKWVEERAAAQAVAQFENRAYAQEREKNYAAIMQLRTSNSGRNLAAQQFGSQGSLADLFKWLT